MTNFEKWRDGLTMEEAIELLENRCSHGCVVIENCGGISTKCKEKLKHWMENDIDTMGKNVIMIRDEGIRVIEGHIPSMKIRNELYDAVKKGQLGHVRKDHLKPEIFYHPDCEKKAKALQEQIALESIERIKKCFA